MAHPPPSKKGNVARNHRISSRNGAERSAYFARREAAGVLRRVIQDDAARRATASIKSLVYSPSVRNKKATFALVCQTLKCLPVIKDVLVATQILNNKWKKQAELVYVTLYDILFGQEIAMTGAVEKFLTLHKNKLEYALAKICAKRKVTKIEDLLQNNCVPVACKPRYIRINTLKVDAEVVMQELGKTNIMVSRDDIIPEVLSLASGIDLHDHPLVCNGSIFLQGKASSMVAVALNPIPGWKVLDACAAPGNKTAHLAALMKGQGKIIACELNEDRLKTLEETIRRSGASNVDVMHGDFLDINTTAPLFKEVHAILLDPSCSGSGISAERLDHLLPSYEKGEDADACKSDRVKKLAAFQTKALLHALSFPAVERVVYSTCSVYQTENEDVIKSVLPFAKSLNFELVSPFPQWPHRGLPVFDGAEHLLRTNPKEDTEGFFIALFVRKSEKINRGNKSSPAKKLKRHNRYMPYPFCKLSAFWFHKRLMRQGSKKNEARKW
ncbi:25S rRNA (cytosine-C(5))-methyltransferase NSUN5-like isoform X1 [Zingiber officinale]|uniref:25S rRNA (cytosine-C(5))-methyltransferase NSUN5-like isoform X1 n=1 Tax=Zingiber officinale TaxID=94328 RepID=UPI001C4D257D|nr:25S rRNA (cytosine-C(5))-methyltransferase NSUN5-like isoform X1 [Zingiber officinale]